MRDLYKWICVTVMFGMAIVVNLMGKTDNTPLILWVTGMVMMLIPSDEDITKAVKKE